MKTNNWHYTEKGPEKCRRSLRLCPEYHHFGSREIALDFGERVKKTAAWDKKISELQKMIDTPDPNRPLISVLSGSRFGGARNFGDRMDHLFHDKGITPSVFPGQWSARVQNGSYKPVEITLRRRNIVDKKRGRIAGTWEATIETTKSEYLGFEKVKEKTDLDLSNPDFADGRIVADEEFDKLQEVFRRALELSGIQPYTSKSHLMGSKTHELMSSFMDMFNAVESEAMGEAALADMGFGYFRGSSSGQIRANEEYSFSALRGRNFHRYLTQNNHFKTKVPQVDIRITDWHQYSDAYWSLYYYDGVWGVQFTKHDGDVGEYTVRSAQDAYEAVRYHVLYNEGRPGDEKVAEKKATFAYQFVWDVNKALTEHKEQVAVRLAEAGTKAQ